MNSTRPAPEPTGLIGIPLEDPVVTRVIGLIQRRGRELMPSARLFYDMLLHARKDKPPRASSSRKKLGRPLAANSPEA